MNTQEELDRAFNAGYEAMMNGPSKAVNPHDPEKQPDLYRSWNNGTRAALTDIDLRR